LDDLEKVLRDSRGKHKNALIVTEGLYSMDGDFRSAAADRDQDALRRRLMWMGPTPWAFSARPAAAWRHFGIDFRGRHLDGHAQTLGSCGGYICGSKDLIQILKYQARVRLFRRPAAAGTAALAARGPPTRRR
jgi:hypothetical protein